MIISKQAIVDTQNEGIRIACATDQNFAIAKHLISKQIDCPVSDMIAFYTPNGNIAVTTCKPRENNSRSPVTIGKE